jgi:hypothetical protein
LLGGSNTITGFNTGIIGMQVGGTRTVIIPPDLGYVRPLSRLASMVFRFQPIPRSYSISRWCRSSNSVFKSSLPGCFFYARSA